MIHVGAVQVKSSRSVMESNIRELIKEVLDKGYLMSLATLDDGGAWVADVIYIFDEDLNIYWMSHPDTRHSKAIINNPKIAGAITANNPGEDNLGLQFEGIAEKIEGERYELTKKHYAKRKKLEPKEGDHLLKGDCWYVIRPSKIELIYEKLFGFNKQKLEL